MEIIKCLNESVQSEVNQVSNGETVENATQDLGPVKKLEDKPQPLTRTDILAEADEIRRRIKSGNGARRYSSLFVETCGFGWNDKVSPKPVYSLEDVRKWYLELRDPTEYFIALKVLGDWEHWKRLVTRKWFQKYITAWREELDILLIAEGIQDLRDKAKAPNAVSAAKWLAERGWAPPEENRGRPSKQKIVEEAKKLTRLHDEFDEDLDRMETYNA